MTSLSWFDRFSKWSSRTTGRPGTFVLAVVVVVVWFLTGPIFNFSENWQLIINTGTTIVTFLMVFVIQSAQNRDMAAIHLKLNELIRALEGAHNRLLDLEQFSEQDLTLALAKYQQLASKSRELVEQGQPDVGSPEVDEGEAI